MSASFSSGLATFVSEPVGQPAGTAIITATATATGGTGATKITAAPTATSSKSWIFQAFSFLFFLKKRSD
jgi:hypothetical protein